jgi:hypothetical protein
VTAIVHTTAFVSILAVLGLTLRSLAPYLKPALREFNILVVIVMMSWKKLSARTGLATVRELVRHDNDAADYVGYVDAGQEVLAAIAVEGADEHQTATLSRTEPAPSFTQKRSA